MPRFVILRHETPPGYDRPPHWDLMLEEGSALRTFALPHWPAAGEAVPCEQIADHRLAYLDYEGPVAGGRGHVTRQDAGTYDIEGETGETLAFRLKGQRLQGLLSLRRLPANVSEWEATWQPSSSDA